MVPLLPTGHNCVNIHKPQHFTRVILAITGYSVRAMLKKRYNSAQEILKDPTGDIGKLREMGITDFALITYVVRVEDGKSEEAALQGLLQGRSLTSDEVHFVRRVLERYPIRLS